MTLPVAFIARPIAHRALHDKTQGRPENSIAAIRAAIAAGYGIELDVQLSADGQAMVFHDYDLDRLTGEKGALAQRAAAELGKITLRHASEGIPTLPEVLAVVAGRVPLLIEIKDQDGACGPNVGPLERATAAALRGYEGPVAVMSFNPHSVASFAQAAPDVPRGLTVGGPDDSTYYALSERRRAELSNIEDFDRVGASFISHDYRLLDRPAVTRLKQRGIPILCWTIRSAEAEAEARKIADNVTFEGYPA
jgi:glycerophosphoryl diester phosphodiesterase